ncbi:bifunctional folylpolyglutamate synthase/dihydrofolate synthase [Synergistaceae bacterium OttesenSCG-928-I11]|nr:bifunctional folylpolyglutamate synthase/dihydrofolate synthase [Synergistaceae bacterium OttesenSCG-928-I11]
MQFSSLGIRPGLERTSRLLSLLGSPQKRFRAIHVLGTNGKGSTAATLEAILKRAGVRTALYTSPHLVSLQERLRIDGRPLPIESWNAAFDAMRSAVEHDEVLGSSKPTFFENLTAMAFSMITDENVGIAVIEAGMGGRYDATSTCDPIATVITPIGMDHMEYLGSTIEAIASEKFAAVRGGVPAFYAADDATLTDQFLATCDRVGAQPFLLDRIALPRDVRCDLDGTSFSLSNISNFHTPLIGVHQAENAAHAVVVLQTLLSKKILPPGCSIDEKILRDGLRDTNWPGRFERFRCDDGLPDIVVDGAHNAHGMRALVETLSAIEGEGKGSAASTVGAVVFAVMKDKDIAPVLEQLKTLRRPLYCTEPPNPRAMPHAELAEIALSLGVDVAGSWEDPFDALHAARMASNPSGFVLCCGSLFLAGHIRARYAE